MAMSPHDETTRGTGAGLQEVLDALAVLGNAPPGGLMPPAVPGCRTSRSRPISRSKWSGGSPGHGTGAQRERSSP